MKVSIIIPVYGVEKYIEKCIVSILEQTYKNIEIIVVNDGTKDNSIKIIEKYTNDKRIKIINKKNGGLSSARNAGLKIVTGEYIFFVDGDDWVDKTWIESILRELNNEDIGVFSFTCYDDRNKKIKRIEHNEDIKLRNKGYLYFEDCNFAVWNKVYKKDYIKNIFFKEGIIYEDILWGVYTLFSTINIKYINNYGYYYRENRKGSTMNSSHKDLDMYSYNETNKGINKYISKMEKQLSKVAKLLLMMYREYYYSIARENVELDLREINSLYKEINISIDAIEKKKVNRVLKSLLKVNKIDKIEGISLFDSVYWKEGIYKDKKIFRRMLKREIRKLF